MHGLLVFDQSNDPVYNQQRVASYTKAFDKFHVSTIAVTFEMLNRFIETTEKGFFAFAILIDEDSHVAKFLEEDHGIKVFNSETAVNHASDKALALIVIRNEGISTPPTYILPYLRNQSVLTSQGELDAIIKDLHYPCLMKERFYKAHTKPYFIQDETTLWSTLKQLEMKALMIQQYIPFEGRKEFHVFVVGTRVISAMELRQEKDDLFLVKCEIPTIVKNISLKALKSMSADFGLVRVLLDADQIPYVYAVETNPDVVKLQSVTGVFASWYIARHILKHLNIKV
jgi:glutathione synthase/RimK-type ligase-like ATP-grasp enzyme